MTLSRESTKRVLRAILKAADLCAADPQRAAQQMVDGGFTARYDYAVQALNDVPYTRVQFVERSTLTEARRCVSSVCRVVSSPPLLRPPAGALHAVTLRAA